MDIRDENVCLATTTATTTQDFARKIRTAISTTARTTDDFARKIGWNFDVTVQAFRNNLAKTYRRK